MDVLGGSDGTSCRLRCQELNDDSLTDIFITTLGELPGIGIVKFVLSPPKK